MIRKTALFCSAFCLTVIFISGCATNGGSAAQNVPDWVLNPPSSDAEYTYYVAYASATDGNIAKAEAQAKNILIEEVVREIGTEITSETFAVVETTDDSMQTNMYEEIKSKSNARLSDFTIEERHVHEENGRVTVYVLGRYSTEALDAEKKRVKREYKERYDAVIKPMRAAEMSESTGEYFEAIELYIEAAVAAATSKIANADIFYEQSINKAKSILSRVNMIKLNDNLSVVVGSPFSESFRLKVVYGASQNGPAITSFPIIASYSIIKANGRPSRNNVTIMTDESGIAEFQYPVPDYIINRGVVEMRLDISKYLEPLEEIELTDKQYAVMDSFQDFINDKGAVFRFSIESGAKNVPTGIYVLQLDQQRDAIMDSSFSSGILQGLTKNGFKVSTLNIDSSKLKTMNTGQVVNMVKSQYGGKIQNAIIGTASINSFEEDGPMNIVGLDFNIQVVDLESGATVFSYTQSRLVTVSGNRASALSRAFKIAGSQLAKEIASSM